MSVEKLVQRLQDLTSDDWDWDIEEIVNWAEKILKSIFKIEISKTQLTENDKKVIGPLLNKSLDAICSWIFFSEDWLQEFCFRYYVKSRSGLAFLLERYRDFPDGEGNSLAKALDWLEKSGDIDRWDDRFKLAYHNSRIDPPNTHYETPVLTDDEMACVPETHWWWKDFPDPCLAAGFEQSFKCPTCQAYVKVENDSDSGRETSVSNND